MSDNQRVIQMATQSDSCVLILGPTGCGKTTLARQIHAKGGRFRGPFVTVNLATLHEGTLEAELFGHERGAYTGADGRRMGRLEQANGGTVFLDEIGELSPRLQARLLEFLQSKKISRMGGRDEIQLDVRVISATHRDLRARVRCGEFREDLFHRLCVLEIEMPSLAARADEFGEIVHSTLESVASTLRKPVLRISPEVAHLLERYDWPGNFRELRNVLEFAVLACDDGEIRAKDLPARLTEAAPLDSTHLETPESPVFGVLNVPLAFDFRKIVDDFESEYLRRALSRYHGRINLTARKLGLNKTTLIRKIRAYSLDHELRIGRAYQEG